MTSKLTIEQARRLRNDFECWQQDYDPKDDKEQYDMFGRGMVAMDMLIAGMYQEPVAYMARRHDEHEGTGTLIHAEYLQRYQDRGDYHYTPLYRHAQPAPDREQVRREHAEWSQGTFGNVGPVGPLKHLSKEALEAAEEPGDLSEWADMQFLMWDAQRRAGITDEQITQAMIEKLVVNKQRSWPEPKEGEPRLHIKEQPAQVVPEKATVGEMPFLGTSEGAYVRDWNDCRAAMLQESQKSAGESNNCRSNEKLQAQHVESLTTIKATPALDSLPKNAESRSGNSLANDTNVVKRLTITLPDTSSKAFWSGTGKTETFHPVTYRRWVKEAIERYCAIARIDVEVK